jgi:DUF1680 family protein
MKTEAIRNGDYSFQPVPFTKAKMNDCFWSPRVETNRNVTIAHALRQCEESGRIENFKIAGGLSNGKWRGGAGYYDSDVSKVIEGAAYCLSVEKDPRLEARIDEIIGYYAAAQEPDGFLYTLWTARGTLTSEEYSKLTSRPELADRWSNYAAAHSDYNAGHMYEAGVAYFLATGKRALLDVCLKNADLFIRTCNPQRRIDPPGHQEVEIGLVKLYRLTGERKYLEQAVHFLEMRGRNLDRREKYEFLYGQDHIPVVEQSEAVGHAVRANYMYAGMADVAALTGNADYIEAIDRIWENVVGRKLYVTGGVGARRHGEAYGDDYELPNKEAYNETCAAIANVYWNHRMFLLHGDAKYIDVMERSLYNGVLSGVSLDGKSFFYPNPLMSDGGYSRKEWFGCACCPSNITRFLASLGGYIYASRDLAVYINLYIAGSVEIETGGVSVRLTQSTRYPWDGKVVISVDPQTPAKFALNLRIPGWAREEPVPGDLYHFSSGIKEKTSLKINGVEALLMIDRGYAVIDRVWRSGDCVELVLPMPVRRVLANEKVEADRDRVALQRGPLVYCVEHPEIAGTSVHELAIPDDAELRSEWRGDLLGGVQVVTGTARNGVGANNAFTAIPYYAWANRGPGNMAVWLKLTN